MVESGYLNLVMRQVFRAADQRERQQRRLNGSPGAPAAHTLF